jgi:ATP-dependent Lon protease
MTDFLDRDYMGIMGGLEEADSEFIPLVISDEDEDIKKEHLPIELPILPLRNNVLFPGVVIPITVGRDKSLRLIQDVNKGSKLIGVVSQVNQSEELPEFKDLHSVGTMANILRLLKMPDGSTTVIIQGKKCFEWTEEIQSEPYLKAKVNFLTENKPAKNDKEFKLMLQSMKDMSLQIIRDSPNIPSEASFAINNIKNMAFLVNLISSNMNADVAKKQKML